ncbi:ankyrin repeat domain-containing protein [Cruoricaptor ignavus]|uniref:ankyrin repeat domain-containing protein n=1 Tax=Cruoricaptor ignavus TaxID=1118202 RepID=UPI00370D6706
MKLWFRAAFLMFASSVGAQNKLLDQNFWKSNPDLASVKAVINEGNSPSELSDNGFDPVAVSAMNGAAPEVVIFLMSQPGNSVDKILHHNANYLHWLAFSGNTPAVEEAIRKGADIRLVDSHGLTPLGFGLTGRAEEAIAEAFFKAGYKPVETEENGATLLMLAVAHDKNFKKTDYLLSKGLSLNDKDHSGATVFDYAARSGDVEFLKKLLQKGAKPTEHAILYAAAGTRAAPVSEEVFKFLINDLKLNPKMADSDGNTALHLIASKKGSLDAVKFLVSKGLSLDLPNTAGDTPVILAGRATDASVAGYFFDNTQNINTKSKNGTTVLLNAAAKASPEVLELALNKGADVKAADNQGKNALYYLINSYSSKTAGDFDKKLKILQKAGLNLAAVQGDGSNAYHIAIAKNDPALLEKVSTFGADINQKNKEGYTPLHRAAMLSADDTLMKSLLTMGADKSVQTEFGETAYELAAENESLKKNNVNLNFLK